MTGSGSSAMNRSSRNAQTSSMSTPASMTDGKTSSMPEPFPPETSGTPKNPCRIAAKDPVAPSTMPGLPPSKAHISPTIHAAWSATGGLTRARYEKAIVSGI